MKWYYAKDGERFGPVDFAKLQELIQNAELKPEDLIWNPSLGEEWQEAAKIDGLFSTESSSENLDFTERELNYGEYKDPGQTSNSELMRSARESLAGKWGFAVGITLLYSCIIFIVPSFFGDSAGLINLLLNGPLLLGLTIVFLKIAQNQSAEVKDLFGGFQRFWIPLAAQLLVGLFVFLWSILLLIPGIIATYAYSMTFLIIADNPEIGPYEAIKQSVAMMKGYKLKMFFLSLRFLGWTILACFTFGIGFLWLTPYVYTSLAKFYLDIKTEEAEIVRCPECRRKISDKAISCPRCGCVLSQELIASSKKQTSKSQLGIVIFIIALFVMAGIISNYIDMKYDNQPQQKTDPIVRVNTPVAENSLEDETVVETMEEESLDNPDDAEEVKETIQYDERALFEKSYIPIDCKQLNKDSTPGQKTLYVWSRYLDSIKTLPVSVRRSMEPELAFLEVDYDEIIEYLDTRYLSEKQIEESADKLKLFKVYWKNNRFLAMTQKEFFEKDPVTKETLANTSRQITNIYGRNAFFKLWFEEPIDIVEVAEKPFEKTQIRHHEFMAKTSAKNAVKARLKSPRTAKFPSRDWQTSHLGDGVYEMISYVDSENSFGATIRTNFYIKIKVFDHDDFAVLEFKTW